MSLVVPRAETPVTIDTQGRMGRVWYKYLGQISSAIPVAANPTVKVGPTAVVGTATTFMRADAAPAIDLTATYAWTGHHSFTGTLNVAALVASGAMTAASLATTGALTAASLATTGAIGSNGATPPAQLTGWGAPTGPAVVNNYSGGAATLVQTSNAVAQIIAYLLSKGDFGA